MASKRCIRRRRERVSRTMCRSQRLHIERCCLNKQPFDTFDQAEGEMLSLMGASYYDGEDLTSVQSLETTTTSAMCRANSAGKS